MQLFDEKFKKNKARYVLQCSLAAVTVFIVLLILDVISNAAVIAALGASSFIAFAMPETRSARPRYMIGGYIVGTISGCLCHYIHYFVLHSHLNVPHDISVITLSGLSVGLAMFLMAITNTEHPPSAGVALGLVFDGFSLVTIIVIIVGIVCLSIIKTLLMPFLKNLY